MPSKQTAARRGATKRARIAGGRRSCRGRQRRGTGALNDAGILEPVVGGNSSQGNGRALAIGLASAAAGLTVGALAMGLPKRSGLTAAQALVSMPGDLVFPAAGQQADRAVELAGPAQIVWPLVEELAARYAKLWGAPLEVVYRRDGELLVAQTAGGPVDEGAGIGDAALAPVFPAASVAIRLIPGVDGTTDVRIRERFLTRDKGESLRALWLMAKSAAIVAQWAVQSRRLMSKTTEGV